jgi:uncharacterized secreted protein with C-terminal beta-propeller domain
MSTVVFSGCITSDNTSETDGGITPSDTAPTQELKRFSSVREIREFLRSRAMNMLPYEGPDVLYDVMPAQEKAISSQGASALEYSTTNIQVEGVDEADFVKNDGKYIYVLTQDKLVIVDAYPPEKARILSTLRLPGTAENMFVKDDRLLVFSEEYREILFYPEYDFRPRTRSTQVTNILIYNISNREQPQLEANYTISGDYFQSRMIGDYVYFIVQDDPYYYNDFIDVPVIRAEDEVVLRPDVYYFDNPEEDYVFHTFASVNITDGRVKAKSFLLGYSDNLYVSADNIYITYQKRQPPEHYLREREEKFYRIVVPLLPPDAQKKINALKQSNLDSFEKWERITSVLEETYNHMDEREKQALFNKIEEALAEYETEKARERDKTVIHKFRIDEGEITYVAKAEVSGTLLNQFSMDEYKGYLRVATTTQFWTRGRGLVQFNNVYVLDPAFNITGKLEEIALDERIFSTRFIGDRLYMVTFKRIDPLFVVDLSNPQSPQILGKLKIPGFSDYLHPYDENHIIGVGKETSTSEWGGVSIKGVKLSLFDVSDVEHPAQIDTYEIGLPGTDSEALRDYKAFLFDKNKSLLVIPIREVRGERGYDERIGYYTQRIWQGAYVFNLTLKDGFILKGTVTHLEDYEQDYYYGNSPSAVRRSLYMNNTLYTISARKILMNDLDDLSEINRINLPFEEGNYQKYVREFGR